MGLFPIEDPAYAATYAEEAAMVDASELIADALEASGMSQSDLARTLGVSRSEVSARLRGDRNITVRNLAATVHALGARLELGVEIPKSAASQVRPPIEMSVYRRWATPPVSRDHHDGAPRSNGYEMARQG